VAKRGRHKVKTDNLAYIIEDAQTLLGKADAIVGRVDFLNPAQTAEDIREIVEQWTNSSAAAICDQDEELARCSEGMLKAILFRMLRVLEQTMHLLQARMAVDGDELSIKDLTNIAGNVGGLLNKFREPPSGSRRRSKPQTMEELDAQIAERQALLDGQA
jgi:hypothetical protein